LPSALNIKRSLNQRQRSGDIKGQVATIKNKKIVTPRGDSTRSSVPTTTDQGLFNSLQKLNSGRVVLLICLLCFLGYANSLGGEFVFDDTDQIVENQNIRSWDNLQKAFTTHVWAFRANSGALETPPPLPYYRPLFTVMLTVEYHLFGLWPQGWHLVSLLLHILCSVGVFYVIRQLSGNSGIAIIAAALFSVHPVHAESVSWISGMTDPLFGVFFLSSFYFYLRARGEGENPQARARLLLLSLAAFVLAAFAKETGLSLLALVFGYELNTGSGQIAQRLAAAVKRTVPYAAAALIYLIPRYLVLRELMWSNPQAPERPFSYTLLTLPFVICSYIYHLLWPIGLSVTYQTSFITSVTSLSFWIPAALLILGLSSLVFYRRKISREVLLGLLLIFVPILPVLNLGQVSREEYLVFDHYLYLSVSGLTYLIAVAFLRIGAVKERTEGHGGRLNRPAVATLGIVGLTLAMTIAASLENTSWRDSYSLWSNVARVRPGYWAGYYNAGLALLDANRVYEAQSLLERAGALKSDESNVFAALGRSYDLQGETTRAVSSFKRALEIDPEMFQSYNDLGAVYFKSKDYRLAETNFAAALRLRPDTPISRFNLGLCYAREERYSEATRELERVIQLMPRDAYALYELGLAYEKLGRMEEARRVMIMGQGLARSEELASKITESLNRFNESTTPNP